MGLLDELPHTATASRRRRGQSADGLGGTGDTFPTVVFSDRPCWQQSMSSSSIREFEKRGVRATDKIYFTDNPQDDGLDERDLLTVTNPLTGRTDDYEVTHFDDPDASAGLGWLYKVIVAKTTTGSTGGEG